MNTTAPKSIYGETNLDLAEVPFIILYCFDRVVNAAQCTSLRSIVLPRM